MAACGICPQILRPRAKARRSILQYVLFRRGNRESSGKHVAVFYDMYFGEGIASRVESTSQYFTTCILARESPVEWKARRSILQHIFWRGNRQSSGKHVAVCILARESPVEWKARHSILHHVFWRGNRECSGKHVAVFYNMYFGEGIASAVESTSLYFTCILARESRFRKARRNILHVFWRGNRQSMESTSQYFTTCILARESPVEWKARRSILQHVFWRGNRQSRGKHVAQTGCRPISGDWRISRPKGETKWRTISAIC